jgi:hypothetical protein
MSVPSPYIVSSKGLVFSSGTIEVVGEAANPGATPICYAQIAVRFYDTADQLVAVDDGSTYLTATRLGERNPFKTILFDAPKTIDHYRTSLSWSQCFGEYRSLTVLSQQVRNNNGPEVFGEIRNDHDVTMSGVDVALTFYDAAGAVAYTDWDLPSPSTLAPGGRAIYSMPTFVRNLTYARYTVPTPATPCGRRGACRLLALSIPTLAAR